MCTAEAPDLRKGIDAVSGSGDDAFSNGTKDDDDPPTLGSGGVPPNKDDLTRFYVSDETVGGKAFLYLAWERSASNTASAHEGFEFNKNRCVYETVNGTRQPTAESVCSANGVTPTRSAGDALIVYDFAGGTSVPTIGVLRWLTVASFTAGTDTCEVAKAAPCWGNRKSLSDFGFAEALTNNSTVGEVLDPINPSAPRTIGVNGFGEAAINLTDSGILPSAGPCVGFGSAYVVSRSSGNSAQSVRKDFIAPIPVDINNCQPATISIRKVDQNGNNLAGATIGLYNDQATGTNHTVFDAADTLATVVSGPGFSANPCLTTNTNPCVWKVTGTGTNHYVVRETVAPTNYQLNTTAVHVDVTFTSSAQSITLPNLTNTPAPRDLVIRKNDDGSPANPVQGVVFRVVEDFVPTADAFEAAEQTAYADANVRTCTTGVNGQCTITSLDPGKFYWIVEHSKPAGYGEDTGASPCTVSTGPDVVKKCRRIEVPIGTGSVGPTGATFTNPRLFKVVTFVCRKTDNTLYASEATYDGAALSIPPTNNTATSGSPAAITSAVQTAICGMTGGSVHDNVTYGEHSPNKANIPR